LTFSYYRSKR